MGAVKTIGIDAALRIAEMEYVRDGVGPKCVGPDEQPAQQIARDFNDHKLPRWPRQIKTELAIAGVEIGNGQRRVSFPDRAEVKIRHIEVARAVHCHAARTVKLRGAARPVRVATNARLARPASRPLL